MTFYIHRMSVVSHTWRFAEATFFVLFFSLGWKLIDDLQAQKTPGRNGKPPPVTFSQVLKNSVERETTSKGWCSRCQRYQTIATRKSIHSIPVVLMLNTAITNPEHRMLWSTPGWLPEEIGIIVDRGQFYCYEGEDLKLHLQRGMHEIAVYSLIGTAVNIESGQAEKPHLVAMINGKASPTSVATTKRELALTYGGQWLMRNPRRRVIVSGIFSTTFWFAPSTGTRRSTSTPLGKFRR